MQPEMWNNRNETKHAKNAAILQGKKNLHKLRFQRFGVLLTFSTAQRFLKPTSQVQKSSTTQKGSALSNESAEFQ